MREALDGEVTEAPRHAAAQLGQDLSRTAYDAREAAKDLTRALGRAAADAAVERTEHASLAIGVSMRRNPALWLAAAAGLGALGALWLSDRPARQRW